VTRAEACLRAKFHLDPSNRLAAIHQRYRQDGTGQTGQRSDSIGRTVLQTVAQKVRVDCDEIWGVATLWTTEELVKFWM